MTTEAEYGQASEYMTQRQIEMASRIVENYKEHHDLVEAIAIAFAREFRRGAELQRHADESNDLMDALEKAFSDERDTLRSRLTPK